MTHEPCQERKKWVDKLTFVKEKKSLLNIISKLKDVATNEQQKAKMAERDLFENCKYIKMLNSGFKELDLILSIGQQVKVNIMTRK